MTAQKLYCYVDESGLDTRGEAFFVAVVITEGEQQPLRERLEQIEQDVGKIRPKWSKTFPEVRLAYMRRVLEETVLFCRLSFRGYLGEGDKDYLGQTAATTADALVGYVEDGEIEKSQVTILVDGLPEASVDEFRRQLRPKLYASERAIDTRKIRGLRDDNDALMRLADAVVGFVRSARTEKDKELVKLLEKALKAGSVVEV